MQITIVTIATMLDLLQLVTLVATSPLRPAHAINILSYLPEEVSWHQTDVSIFNTTDGTPPFPKDGRSVKACNHVAYDEVSPARTSVVREDCVDLAKQVRSAPGFWELYKWSGGNSGAFKALVSNGTCEFAVKRHDTPSDFNTTNSDVAIVGNQDVFTILNASVYDLAATADEPYVDAERNQGHMNCKWWFAVNTTMDFRIQKTGTQ